MKLKIKGYQVVKLELGTDSHVSPNSTNDDLSFQIGQFYNDKVSNEFMLGFKVSISRVELQLNLEMRFIFEADSNIDEEFKQSSFPKINAPAIAFPYLRAFISTLTMQAGYETLMLPSFNFVEIAKKDC
ncbi:MAG: protein-export chaperone SecB [Muribaculaceae bacterium]|nr:protein-export chaperone SecB [Muribaculaceae bacterium]